MRTSNKLLEKTFISSERCWRDPVNALGQGGQQVLVTYGSTYVHIHPCRLALTRTTETIRTIGQKKKQEDTKIPSKPDFHNESKIVDASNSESDDEQALIETTNQNSQSLTSNLTPNDQSKTIDQMPTT